MSGLSELFEQAAELQACVEASTAASATLLELASAYWRGGAGAWATTSFAAAQEGLETSSSSEESVSEIITRLILLSELVKWHAASVDLLALRRVVTQMEGYAATVSAGTESEEELVLAELQATATFAASTQRETDRMFKLLGEVVQRLSSSAPDPGPSAIFVLVSRSSSRPALPSRP